MISWINEFQNIFIGKKILITGASGFVGSHLCDALTELGAEIFALDYIAPNKKGHFSYQYQKVDISNYAQINTSITEIKPDIIYHLAAMVTAQQDISFVLPMLQNNLVGTVNLLLAAEEANCERIVIVGSAEETDNMAPGSPYAASKSAASLYAKMFASTYKLPVVIVRLFMTYGPRQKETKIIPYAILSILQNKLPHISSPERDVDFVYIQDVVRGLLLAGSHPNIENKMFQFGTGVSVKIKDVIDIIATILQKNTSLVTINSQRPDEKKLINTSNLSRELLGWKPTWILQDGLAETIEWYQHKLEQHEKL